MRDNLFHASTAESIGSRHAGTYPHAKMRIGCRMRTAGENATNCGGLIRRYLKRAPVPPHRARGRRLVASRLPLPPLPRSRRHFILLTGAPPPARTPQSCRVIIFMIRNARNVPSLPSLPGGGGRGGEGKTKPKMPSTTAESVPPKPPRPRGPPPPPPPPLPAPPRPPPPPRSLLPRVKMSSQLRDTAAASYRLRDAAAICNLFYLTRSESTDISATCFWDY